ncbi:COX15/CtaA family protein [Mycetocola saprophilus]|uniref:COX15/CtaA family protein n=1 Tax=Mycetocola saprophilus TaxID=76636 RepID=UPI00068F0D17|nr:COX15/CtaA family protein [Mycetocola saprophilus]
MTTTSRPTPSLYQRITNWLPQSVNRPVRVFAWLSLIFQTVLIGTGGAVRLTGSGLGCPTWPKCTPESLTSTPEMGIHGIIEFGNRTLTFVLVIIAIGAFLSVWNLRKRRRDLFWLTFAQGMSIPLQAVLGGIVVLTGLNSYLVGAHFVISLVLVGLTTALVYRAYKGAAGPKRSAAPYRILTHIMTFLVALAAVMGILTTGSGPHAGDANVPRNGLNPEFMQHLHSWPGYLMFASTVLILIIGLRLRYPVKPVVWLLVGQVAQIVLGIAQSRLGLPEIMVGTHMVLAGVVIALATRVMLDTRSSIPEPEQVSTEPQAARA